MFLSLTDYSFDAHILRQLEDEAAAQPGSIIGAAHPAVQAIGVYYDWRITGALRYWDLVMGCLMPLALIGLLADVGATLRGRRAPLLRHLLDAESLLQLLTVVGIIVSTAAPTIARLVEATKTARTAKGGAAAAGSDFDALHELRTLANVHFLVLVLQALQWFVPLMRWNLQRKHDRMMAAEATAPAAAATATATPTATTAAGAKVVAAAAAPTPPTAAEMEARMDAAEASAQPDGELRKRK